MRREKSWTRIEYEFAYRQMRRGLSFDEIYERDEIALGFVKAADYSYQGRWYIVSGWISAARCKRFYAIFRRVYTSRGEIPY